MRTYTALFDIGNTNIKIGFADPSGIVQQFSLPTNQRETADSLGLALEGLRTHMGRAASIAACVGSSVAPAVTPLVRDACSRFWGKNLLLAPEDIPIPLENRYERPMEVGADRLVGAYAARRLLPDAKSIVSVDYGTATTFDCVTDNAYLGGLICPGVHSALEALATRAAKLQSIGLSFEAVEPEPGRSTATSINHGFVFGFAAMTEGLAARMAKNLPGPVSVVATGGFARGIARVTDCFTLVRPDLLLEGLRLLHIQSR